MRYCHRRTTLLARAAWPTVAVITASLALAACGSSSGSGQSTASEQSTASSSSSSSSQASGTYDSALAKLLPATITKSGVITVASNATYPPDEYLATNNTTVIGFDPELAAAVGKILGVTFKFTNTPFDEIIPGLQAGRFDIGWSTATATAVREQQVNFVTYFQSGIGFLVPANTTHTINGISDLCGMSVAVESGALEQTTAQTQSAACKAQGKPGINILAFGDENQELLSLSSGRAQVNLAGSQIIPYLAKQSNGKFKVVGDVYDVGSVGVEIPKNAPAGLAQAIQGALNKIIANGTYGKILGQWNEQPGEITASQILPASAG